MSRFFAQNSESESETESSENEAAPKPAVVSNRVFQWSDDEEDTKRVVRSTKDKRYEDIHNVIKNIRNHKKIKDMASLLIDFGELTKAFDKAKNVIEREEGGVTPRFYVKCLSNLDEFVNEVWEDREGHKAMSKNNAKGLSTLRQKFRRYLRDFETQVARYRENPDDDVDDVEHGADEDSASDDDDDDDVVGKFRSNQATAPEPARGKAVKFEAPSGGEESDSDEEWGSETESSSSDDDEVGMGGMLTADYFRKRTPTDSALAEKKKKKEEKRRERPRLQEEDDDDDEEDEGFEQVPSKGGRIGEKPKLFAKDTEITHDAVNKKLMELMSNRGKKSTDRQDQIELFIELRSVAEAHNLGPALDIKILFSLMASIYDYNPSIASSMKGDMWEKCMFYMVELLDALIAHSDDVEVGSHIDEEDEAFDGESPLRVRGSVLMVVERFDEEYTKMLQACDAHSTEYVDRLKNERAVCDILKKLQGYLEVRGDVSDMCRLYIKRIQHLCYRYDQQSHDESPQAVIDDLCKFIYTNDDTQLIRTRAILCHIYHHALHGRWFEARDLMLMSHLQDTIQHSDIPTQIHYNRAMVQLGLCAFRQGMIKDSHSCLVDIQSSGRAKELLAQGLLLQRQHERTPEQEKIEKRRQIPYHMHINLELLECVYLVSAMLLEIPYMAAHEFDTRRRMISKNFHHVLRVSERQPLVGPPESMREHVVAASKAMKRGDWRGCVEYLINDKMNAKVWDLFSDSSNVREMIQAKVQEESLRTYLFTYSAIYDSLSIDVLAEMFELKRENVHSIISKMIINEELMASLDQPTRTVMMHRTEPTRLQSLALHLSEKVASLVDNNEKLMEAKQGGGFFTYQPRGERQEQSGRFEMNRNQRSGRDERGGNRGERDNRGGNRPPREDRGGNRGGRDDRGGNRGGNRDDYQRNRQQGGDRQYRGDRPYYGGRQQGAVY